MSKKKGPSFPKKEQPVIQQKVSKNMKIYNQERETEVEEEDDQTWDITEKDTEVPNEYEEKLEYQQMSRVEEELTRINENATKLNRKYPVQSKGKNTKYEIYNPPENKGQLTMLKLPPPEKLKVIDWSCVRHNQLLLGSLEKVCIFHLYFIVFNNILHLHLVDSKV
jgi:hypothetical protein